MPNGSPLILGSQNNTASLETTLVRRGGVILSAFHVENQAGGGILGRGGIGQVGPSENPPEAAIYGVWGDSATGAGVYGSSTSGIGVWGISTIQSGVEGKSTNGAGVFGESTIGPGVDGGSIDHYGVFASSTNAPGVFGQSINEAGVEGRSALSSGVRGEFQGPETPGVAGVYGRSANGTALVGESDNSTGVFGTSNKAIGVRGHSDNSTGVFGGSVDGSGVEARSNSRGVLAFGRIGVHAVTSSHTAGLFQGNVEATGHIFGNGKNFRIDHPLDPANKYLHHSAVESPDMKNVYDGVAFLDQDGQTVVSLPEYFEALNKDFRYQLTAIGGAGPNLHIAEEISNKQFKIAGGANLAANRFTYACTQDGGKRNPRTALFSSQTA